MRYTYLVLIVALFFGNCTSAYRSVETPTNPGRQYETPATNDNVEPLLTGADRMAVYLPLLKGKSVAVFANPTSMVRSTHLVDTLLSSGIRIVKIFGPEHGFRGDAVAGEPVTDAKDKKTGLPIVSLYGDHRKPTAADLEDVDVIVFDIQDVGVRFYTYISSLEYLLESALENHKPLLILDRPNPNGFYVDGPILEKKFKSFIGMQPIPIVHGMTIGEYALMLTGERLLSEKANTINAYNVTTKPTADTPFHVQVIKCKNYDHTTKYILPVAPSPNLKTMQAIYLYPSTCFFEGTVLSEGRGTDAPFQMFGHPTLPKTLYSFTPKPNAGAKSSKCFNQKCFGWYLNGSNEEILKKLDGKIQLHYLLEAYKLFPGKDSFFLKNNFIARLAGTDQLSAQVKAGKTEAEIKKSWNPALDDFKKTRKKYLLYKDFY
ncbi:MAG: DUF1343 domain-containing protein [Ferruginibacter sp.]|nr:DUF1343 domain-containing protein [Ferruginibacter sp.]